MNTIVQKFYKLGLISATSIEQYISSVLQLDEQIKTLLDRVGLVRSVSSYDRDYYKTWVNNWGFTDAQVLIVAETAKGKSNPMSYLNKVLASLNEQNIKNDKDIEKHIKSMAGDASKTDKPDFSTRTYSSEEMNALFDSLDDIEI